VDNSLAQADASQFDALLLPGGALNACTLECSLELRNSFGKWTAKASRSL